MMNRQSLGVAGQCINEDAYIEKLFTLSENYNNNQVGYTRLPSNSNQYNSNSFIFGLDAAAGLDMPVPGSTGATTPGYEFPVPIEHFMRGLK